MAFASATASHTPDPAAISNSKNNANQGILSGVINYVARELENFVASATGSTLLTNIEVDTQQNSRLQLETEGCARACEVINYSKYPNLVLKPKHPTTKQRQKRRRSLSNDSEFEGGYSSSSSSNSAILCRRPSFTMPGSLFPRSPSVSPEYKTHGSDVKHVRFPMWDNISQDKTHECEPGPSRPRQSSRLQTPTKVHYTNKPSSSNTAAVQKFHQGNASDSYILLPCVTYSPTKGKGGEVNGALDQMAVAMQQSRDNGLDQPESTDEGSTGLFKIVTKQKELTQAREDQNTNCRLGGISPDDISLTRKSWERDKERIKHLEEEVQRLKQELSRRGMVPSTNPYNPTPSLPPPPPAPPPPPPKTNNLPPWNRCQQSGASFASARAALKQGPRTTEFPLNRLQGQPTVAVAPDKMAAFLTELKTVRLRKVSERSMVIDDTHLNYNLYRSKSNISLSHDVHPGQKRKRLWNEGVSLNNPSTRKRRTLASMPDTNVSNSSLSYPLRSANRLTPSNLSFTLSSKVGVGVQEWRTSSLTDAPTPSLCSDYECEREGEGSLDDPPPSTPPGSSRLQSFVPTILDIAVGNISEDLHNTPNKRIAPDIFDKRLPSSPLPDKSPRKPKPPARIPRPTVLRRRVDSDDEDPLSLTFSSPETMLLDNDRSPVSYRPPSTQPSSSVARYGQTLEEELCRVLPAADTGADDMDCPVLTGVGLLKRSGFLAHGGAGGVPIHMDDGWSK